MSPDRSIHDLLAEAIKDREDRPATAAAAYSTSMQVNPGPVLARSPAGTAQFPTELTRTALFGLPRRGYRLQHQWKLLASRRDVEVEYHGEQLDQADADLWLVILNLAAGQMLGAQIFCTRCKILSLLRKTDGARNYLWLSRSLERLSTAALRITLHRSNQKPVKLVCGLLNHGCDEESGQLVLRLDPDASTLFERRAFLDWEQRFALSTNMARGLHLYAVGHKHGETHRVKLLDLQNWLGFGGRTAQFKLGLMDALGQLMNVGFFEPDSAGINVNAVVYWTRTNASRGTVVTTPPIVVTNPQAVTEAL